MRRRSPIPVLIFLAGTFASPATGETRVGGTISTSTTWTLAGSPWVLESGVFVRGAGKPVLTIEAGVEVKAAVGQALSIGDGEAGELRAIGTAEKPIVFTTAGPVAAGTWEGVYLGPGSGASRLERAVVEGAGRNWKAGIRILGSAPVLKDVTVRTSFHRGISVESGGAPEITGSAVIGTTGGDGTGIHVSGNARVTMSDTAIRGNANGAIAVEAGAELNGLTGMVLADNGQDGVRHLGGELARSETWRGFGYPYFLLNQSVWLRGAGKPVLTIEPGAEVRAGVGPALYIGDGAAGELRAIGTAEKPIVFTTAGPVAAGTWEGVYLGPGSGASRLERAVVEGAGRNWKAGIRILGSAPVLKDVTVRTSFHRGISVESGAAPEITGSAVIGTTGGDGTGIHVSGNARVTMSDTAIRGNANGAIAVEAGAELNGLTGMVLADNGQDGVRHLGGELARSETWRGFGYPYFLLNQSVWLRGAGKPVLTIEPGAEVRAGVGPALYIGDGAAGELRAIGTAEKPIVFTTAGPVAAGTWEGVYLGPGSGASRLERAVVEGAGRNWKAGIRILGSAPVLKDVTVRTSFHRGISVESGGAPEITGSTVLGTTGGDGTGIHVSGNARLTMSDTAIRGNANGAIAVEAGAELNGLTGMVLADNGQDGVRHLGGELARSETWRGFGYPYFLLNQSVWLRGAGKPVLTIEPGAEVRAGVGPALYIGDGAAGELRAIGTAEKPIVFTTAGPVAAGTWEGVYLGPGSGASRLERAVVEGAGRNWKAGIRILGSAPVLKDVTVRTSFHRGISVESGGAPEITGSTVLGTTGGDGTGIHVSGNARLTMSDTAIRGNANGAIAVEAGAELNGLTGMVLADNGQDGVRHLGGELARSETWRGFGYPYFLLNQSVWLRGAGKPVLTIEPGAEVRAGVGPALYIGDGAAGELRAIGTAEKPIVFTTAGPVAAGTWEGVYLGPGSGASRLERAVVEGAGRNWKAGIRILGSAPVLKDVTVRTSFHRGISVESGACAGDHGEHGD